MIKFFRNIRKNLVAENKTSKYFKYAIGEIVLVVIGILIALQINNWNESRKLQYLFAIQSRVKTRDLNHTYMILTFNSSDLMKHNQMNKNFVEISTNFYCNVRRYYYDVSIVGN